MRPQRAAAASASAAIAVLSAEIADNDAGAQETASRGRKKSGKPADDDVEFRLATTKHQAKPSVLENSTGPVVHYETNTFCGLPTELKYQILEHLDSSAFTVLNLLLVSKVWYATLTMGTFADRDWQRRCKLIGVKRRSAGCKTWRDTFMYLLHRRCAECFSETTAKIGQLFDTGFRWLVVCEECQKSPGPFEVYTQSVCLATYGVPWNRLSALKTQISRKEGKRVWTVYLASSVKALISVLREERRVKTEPLLVGLEEAKVALLIEVIDHVEEKKMPLSEKLSTAVRNVLGSADTQNSPSCEELVEMWSLFKTAIEAVRVAFEAKKFAFDPKNPCLFQRVFSHGTTWADGVVTKEVTVDQYVAAALAGRQATIDWERESRYTYDSDDDALSYTSNNLECECGGTAAMACYYGSCYYCCPGCVRHSSKLDRW